VIRLKDQKCITIDTTGGADKSEVEKFVDNNMLYILIGLGILILLKG
jgi:hypothetical protein